MSTKVSDEQLMAYADGELEPAVRANIEQALGADPAVAAKLARIRNQGSELRRKLSGTFDPVLAEPVPPRLTAVLKVVPNKVADISQARAARDAQGKAPTERRWRIAVAVPFAASVAFGLLAGYMLFGRGTSTPIVAADGRIADPRLARALADDLSATRREVGITIGMTYKTKSGEYCRSFAFTGAGGFAGAACHSKDAPARDWRVHVLMPFSAAANPEYRTADSPLPSTIVNAINSEIDGEPLDSEQEAALVADGWKR